MCEPLAAALIESDVFGCGLNVTLDTPLETYCDDLTDPLLQFKEFCLFPSGIDLDPICDQDDYDESGFIFNQMASGNLSTLEELPVLWQTPVSLVGNTDEWTEALSGVTLEGVTIQRLEYFVISRTGVILGQTHFPNGGVSTYVVSDLTTSLFTPIHLPSGASSKLGFNPFLAISDDAKVMAIGPYIWTSATGVWTLNALASEYVEINGLQITTTGLGTFIIYLGSRISTRSTIFMLYIESISMTAYRQDNFNACAGGQRGFLKANGNLIVFSFPSPPATLGALDYVYIRDLDTGSITGTLSMIGYNVNALSDSYQHNYFTGNTIAFYGINGEDGARTIYFANSTVGKGMKMHWTVSGEQASHLVFTGNAYYIESSLDGEFFVMQYNLGAGAGYQILYVTEGVSTNVITPGFTLAQFQRHTIFTNPTPAYKCTVYTENRANRYFMAATLGFGDVGYANPYNLYSDILKINDLGSSALDPAQNPGPQWFFGTVSKVLSVGVLSGISKHNRYKLAITAISTTHTFPNFDGIAHISEMKLYRHNDVYVLQHAHELRLFQNGNIEALNNEEQIIWQTAMDDRNGSSQDYVSISKTKPSMTLNGNYLTFWPEDGTFRQCYYPYNSERCRDWCLLSDTRFSNTINEQQNYCFDNLQNEVTPTNIKFKDDRCCCVGGERLFNNLFINIDHLPIVEKALLLDALPCLMVDCSKSRVNADPTNTFRLLLNKCQVPIIICSVTIRTEDQSSIGGIGVIQDCGSGDFPLPTCLETEECPISTICNLETGMCEFSCASAGDCAHLGLENHSCDEFGGCVPNPSSGLSLGAIIGISVAAVVVVILIAVLLWYFLVFKKKAV